MSRRLAWALGGVVALLVVAVAILGTALAVSGDSSEATASSSSSTPPTNPTQGGRDLLAKNIADTTRCLDTTRPCFDEVSAMDAAVMTIRSASSPVTTYRYELVREQINARCSNTLTLNNNCNYLANSLVKEAQALVEGKE